MNQCFLRLHYIASKIRYNASQNFKDSILIITLKIQIRPKNPELC